VKTNNDFNLFGPTHIPCNQAWKQKARSELHPKRLGGFMEFSANPEAISLNEASITQVELLDGSDLLLGFSNGATVRVPVRVLKNFALVHAKEIVYPDGTTS
jgi:hypothetical protein